MTKSDIVETVYQNVGFTKKRAAEVVNLILDSMKEALEDGQKVKISGFGNFEIRSKDARKGRNPQTGAEITITERRVLTFKPSQVLKDKLNSK
jgi:integration host factor subunit alpha